MEVVNLSPDRIKREMLRGRVARLANVPPESLPRPPKRSAPAHADAPGRRRGLSDATAQARLEPEAPPAGEDRADNVAAALELDGARLRTETRLLAYMLRREDWCEAVCSVRPPEEFGSPVLRSLASEIHDAWEEEGAVDAGALLNRVQDGEASRILSEIALGEGPELRDIELAETLHFVTLNALEEERRRLQRAFRRAHEAGEDETAEGLARDVRELAREIDRQKQTPIPESVGPSAA